jgi:type IV secretory pathway TrbL component
MLNKMNYSRPYFIRRYRLIFSAHLTDQPISTASCDTVPTILDFQRKTIVILHCSNVVLLCFSVVLSFMMVVSCTNRIEMLVQVFLFYVACFFLSIRYISNGFING